MANFAIGFVVGAAITASFPPVLRFVIAKVAEVRIWLAS
jgi:hypothetical protein